MSKVVSIEVESRSGRPVCSVRISSEATVAELQTSIHENKGKVAKYAANRQRLTLPPAPGEKSGKALEAGKTLSFYGLDTGSVVQHKDLGVQVGYSTVFFWEYFGPLLIFPFFWSRTGHRLVYGVPDDKYVTQLAQDIATFYWCIHYLKRIFETFHVHTFSHATMPIANLYRNCSYYWIFAAFVSYFVNHPLYTAPPQTLTLVCFGLAYCCQLGNYLSHVILANLRKGGQTGYTIPRGLLFNYVTCANYTFEIWGWILFSVGTQSLPALIFGACGALQMVQWALAKHARLRKLFDGKDGREKYPRRWVILPPFL